MLDDFNDDDDGSSGGNVADYYLIRYIYDIYLHMYICKKNIYMIHL